MKSKFNDFLMRWLINTVAVLVASYMVSGIHYQTFEDLMIAALILGILNAFLKPLLVRLGILLVILTLGMFLFVINALLLYMVGHMLSPGFVVASFRDAFWGGLVITIVTFFLNILTGAGSSRVNVRQAAPPPQPQPRQNPPDGKGPIIDV